MRPSSAALPPLRMTRTLPIPATDSIRPAGINDIMFASMEASRNSRLRRSTWRPAASSCTNDLITVMPDRLSWSCATSSDSRERTLRHLVRTRLT